MWPPARRRKPGSPADAARGLDVTVSPGGPADSTGEVLFAFVIGGVLRTTELALRLGASLDDTRAVVEDLVEASFLEAGKAPDGLARYRLTPAGRAAAARFLAGERAALAAGIESLLASFDVSNAALKQTLGRWQMKPCGSAVVPNEHDDPAYDDRRLAELGEVVRRAEVWLLPLAEMRPRYAHYRDRLRAALERAGRGETNFVAGIGEDSVHAVWWQLHADLLALLDRPRTGADA